MQLKLHGTVAIVDVFKFLFWFIPFTIQEVSQQTVNLLQ